MRKTYKSKTMRELAQELQDDGMQCNCDLDNWAPESDTGHSWVCRIHREVKITFDHRELREIEEKKTYYVKTTCMQEVWKAFDNGLEVLTEYTGQFFPIKETKKGLFFLHGEGPVIHRRGRVFKIKISKDN